MFPHITIKNLGPVKSINISLNNFNVLTGPQANGKSTIAKVIYYFLSLKDDLLNTISRTSTEKRGISKIEILNDRLKNKFNGVFGISDYFSKSMVLECRYSNETYVRIKTISAPKDMSSEKVILEFEYSKNIMELLTEFSIQISMVMDAAPKEEYDDKDELKKQIDFLLNIDFDTLYIPAGRGVVSSFADMLNYMLADQDVMAYANIDYCTAKFFTEILRIRAKFTMGIEWLLDEKKAYYSGLGIYDMLSDFVVKIYEILKGKYYYRPGNDMPFLGNKEYVKMNYSSSGQQEIVWVLNILFYYLLSRRKMLIIVEEPEAHLFPDTQKKVTELLGMFYNAGNRILFTTHSPYMLGQVNNMLLADEIENTLDRTKIIKESHVIKNSDILAMFVDDGSAVDAMLDGLIKNSLIDGASEDINKQTDRLLELIWEKKSDE